MQCVICTSDISVEQLFLSLLQVVHKREYSTRTYVRHLASKDDLMALSTSHNRYNGNELQWYLTAQAFVRYKS